MINQELKLVFWKYLPLLILLVFIPLLSFLVWLFYPERTLEILVVDKTVTGDQYHEHQSFFWILKYQKYIKNDGEFYDKSQDYLGYHLGDTPESGSGDDLSRLSDREISEKIKNIDLLFFADTYGVFENDFSKDNPNERSKKIYGGLNRGDLSLLAEASKQDKTIIVEFNSMASPTSKSIRVEFENQIGVKWTGWISRYFEELDTAINQNIPRWFIKNYLDQHENQWPMRGQGLVFVHEDGRVEALTYQLDYKNQIPEIRTQRLNKAGFKLPEVVPYPDWFDIVLVERDYEVISYYDIDPSASGVEKLRLMGLPRFFPATVVKNSDQGLFYYLAGDFSDLRSDLGSARFSGLPKLWQGFHLVSDYNDRKSFFWNYYFPLMSQILSKSKEELDLKAELGK